MLLQEVVETTFPEALVNTALGMGTVFIVLILISFIIYLFKFMPGSNGGKKKTEPVKVAPVQTDNKPVAAPKAADDTQIVAVIAAAIAAEMESEMGVPVAADGLVIRSIKKRSFSN